MGDIEDGCMRALELKVLGRGGGGITGKRWEQYLEIMHRFLIMYPKPYILRSIFS